MMIEEMSKAELVQEIDGAPWRYTICCESRSGDFFFEVAKFKNLDAAKMCLDMFKQEYKMIPDVSFTLDDCHAAYNLNDVLGAVSDHG